VTPQNEFFFHFLRLTSSFNK